MRVEILTSAGAAPVRRVQSEAAIRTGSRDGWRLSSVRSPGELRASAELERFRTAVADFVAMCRAEQLPPDAVMTRFEAFLAAWE
jgi:hypothetical protein